MSYKIFSFIYGASIWLVATLVFRFWGHLFFFIDQFAVLASLYLLTPVLLYASVKWVFIRFKLSIGQKLEAAVLMAIPGMFGDVVCIGLHNNVFPTLSVEQSVILASWILWAYSFVILIGFIYGSNASRIHNS